MPAYPASRILPQYAGTAAAITAQVTLNPGDSIDLPADALRNNLGEHILIDTFRWCADAQQEVESSDPPTSPVGFVGGSIRCGLKLGDKPLTGGEVPIYILGKPAGLDVESMILGVADDTNTEFLLGSYCSGVWMLDHPMSLDVNASLSVHITHSGLLNLPVVVSLALTGRVGAELPRSRWLPYVSAWIPKAFDPTVPTATDPVIVTSTERDLVNRIPAPIHVHRLIGRILRIGVVNTPIATDLPFNVEWVFPTIEEVVGGNPYTNFFPNAVDSFMMIAMRDSKANDNIPINTQFRQVFEPESRSWECDHILEENGYFIGQLTFSTPTVLDASVQPVVSFVASWEGA